MLITKVLKSHHRCDRVCSWALEQYQDHFTHMRPFTAIILLVVFYKFKMDRAAQKADKLIRPAMMLCISIECNCSCVYSSKIIASFKPVLCLYGYNKVLRENIYGICGFIVPAFILFWIKIVWNWNSVWWNLMLSQYNYKCSYMFS